MASDSAIQEDVQTDIETGEQTTTTTTTTTQQREPSAREEAYEAIAASRRAELEKETGVSLDPDVDPADAEAEAARAQAIAAANKPADQLEAQLLQPVDEPAVLSQRVKVKIDGQESEVSVEDMRREYQKGRTADRRLEEAAALRRQLEEQAQQRTTNTAPAEVQIDPAVGKAFTSALFEGDEDAANQAFAKAVGQAVQTELQKSGRGNATPVDAQTIAQQVKQQLAFDSVLERNRLDYPQLYSDPDIEALAATKIERAMSGGLAFAEALSSVSGEFATKFGWTAPGRPDPAARTTATRDAKLERKARIDTTSGLGIKSNTTETPPQSTSQVIAEIARARGQGV